MSAPTTFVAPFVRQWLALADDSTATELARRKAFHEMLSGEQADYSDNERALIISAQAKARAMFDTLRDTDDWPEVDMTNLPDVCQAIDWILDEVPFEPVTPEREACLADYVASAIA